YTEVSADPFLISKGPERPQYVPWVGERARKPVDVGEAFQSPPIFQCVFAEPPRQAQDGTSRHSGEKRIPVLTPRKIVMGRQAEQCVCSLSRHDNFLFGRQALVK